MSSRLRILGALEEAEGHISGQALATKLGITRAAVWKHVAALKRAGYEIEGVRSLGYRLVSAPDTLTEMDIGCHLETRSLARRLVLLDRTASTNDDALRLGREGAPDGTVVLAEQQSRGRGRLGRSWVSAPRRNLYMSVLLRPVIAPVDAPQLSLVAGLALARAVEELGVEAQIKWPNDIVVGGRKLAGILTEIEAEADRVGHVVVGMGLNVNSQASEFPAELQSRATSLRDQLGAPLSRAMVLATVMRNFESCLDVFVDGGFAPLAAAWQQRSSLQGRDVEIVGVASSWRGRCAGIDWDGALLVQDERSAQVERVVAGDVTVAGGYRA